MRAVAVALLACTLGVACDDAIGPEDLLGTYTLRTIDGWGPPWWSSHWYAPAELNGVMVVIEGTYEVVSGSLRLDEDATCSSVLVERITEAYLDPVTLAEIDRTVETFPHTTACTYGVTGTAIEVTYADGTSYAGSIAGRTLRIVVHGVTWVYER
jgi:hypothetical protein